MMVHVSRRRPDRGLCRQLLYALTKTLLLAWVVSSVGTVSADELTAEAIWHRIEPFFSPPAEMVDDLGDYRSPLKFYDGRPVRNAEDWKRRREEILSTWHRMMGPWPEVIEDPKVDYLESERRENFTQQRIRFLLMPEHITESYLLTPDGEGRRPAVVVVYYDPETGIGQGKEDRDFAYQLVKRGFVTLSVGHRPGLTSDAYPLYARPEGQAAIQPLSAFAHAAANAYHVMASRPEVDDQRIGIVGHSYGGKWAMFASCLYDKYACAAWSDGGIVFDESRPSVNYWEPWYLGFEAGVWRTRGVPTEKNPRIGLYKRLVEENYDPHELHALMAPRPFLVSGGSEDPPKRWIPLNHAIAVNKLLGYDNRVAMTNRPLHSPNPESNEQVYLFFEYSLKHNSRHPIEIDGPYAHLVMNSEPVAYWRLGEFEGDLALDHSGNGHHAQVEPMMAHYLPGPQGVGFCGPDTVNRCLHFATGRLTVDLPHIGNDYSVEMWFWNDLPNDARPITAYLFSRGPDGEESAPGDNVGISGTSKNSPGLLGIYSRNEVQTSLRGGPVVKEKTWHHLVFVRRGKSVQIFLDGSTKPVVSGEVEITYPAGCTRFCFGGRSDRFANLEGKLDEIAVYDRALSPGEVHMHHLQSHYPQTPSHADFRKTEEALPKKATASPQEKPRKLLILDRANGFYHPTIPLANRAIELMGERTGAFQTTIDHGYDLLTPEKLAEYDGIVLNNASNWRISADQKKALIERVRAGGGLMAIHGATWNFGVWLEGQQMIGGHLAGHPWHDKGTWAVKVDEPGHPLCRGFHGRGFWISDEIYKFGEVYSRDKLRVLVSLDMTKQANQVDGRREDNDHAISWIHQYGKGRVFYCSLGNNIVVYHQPELLQHYLDGIQWILDDLPADAMPSSELTEKPKPALAPERP